MKTILISLVIVAMVFVSGCGKENDLNTKAHAKVRLAADNSFLYLENIDTVKYQPGDTLTFMYDFDATIYEAGWKISRLPYPDTTLELRNREIMFRRGVIKEFR
jgi:hypothetical protein